MGPELARELAMFSSEIGRQIGLLIDRSGTVVLVIVGDNRGLVVPDLGRQRGGLIRLKGLRLVHTHLTQAGLDQDDINDLAALRLDLVAVLLASSHQDRPPAIELAYLMPDSAGDQGIARMYADSAGELDLDFAGFIHSLEEEFSRRQKLAVDTGNRDRSILVSVTGGSRSEAEEHLAELEELARTAGLSVIEKRFFRQRNRSPKISLSRERIQELNILAMQSGVDLLIFDQDLSPAQVNHLSNQTELRIIDRTQLILDIFAQRAQTREGKLQVEMAQLKYLLPRLVFKNTDMSRLTGGIGARGPGETKLEINRRRVRERIDRLRKELDRVKDQRVQQRSKRDRAGLPVVSIVGYTNAGKSTLLNQLTQSDVLAEDKLFATLDPSSRRLRFPRDRSIIITDTVGFIRDLPPDLVDAFSATLEELHSATLLLHVIDAHSPGLDQRVGTVERLLQDLDLSQVPRLKVYNKIDLVDSEKAAALNEKPDAVCLSALDRTTFPPLIRAIQNRLGWVEPETA